MGVRFGAFTNCHVGCMCTVPVGPLIRVRIAHQPQHQPLGPRQTTRFDGKEALALRGPLSTPSPLNTPHPLGVSIHLEVAAATRRGVEGEGGGGWGWGEGSRGGE